LLVDLNVTSCSEWVFRRVAPYLLEEIAGGGTQDNGARMLRGPHKRIWQAEGQEEEAWPGPV